MATVTIIGSRGRTTEVEIIGDAAGLLVVTPNLEYPGRVQVTHRPTGRSLSRRGYCCEASARSLIARLAGFNWDFKNLKRAWTMIEAGCITRAWLDVCFVCKEKP